MHKSSTCQQSEPIIGSDLQDLHHEPFSPPPPPDTCGLHLMFLWWCSNIWAFFFFLKRWLQSGFSALMALRFCQQWHHQALDPLLLCSIDLTHISEPLVLFFYICCYHWLEGCTLQKTLSVVFIHLGFLLNEYVCFYPTGNNAEFSTALLWADKKYLKRWPSRRVNRLICFGHYPASNCIIPSHCGGVTACFKSKCTRFQNNGENLDGRVRLHGNLKREQHD